MALMSLCSKPPGFSLGGRGDARLSLPRSGSSALFCLHLSSYFGGTKKDASLTSGRLLLTWNKIKSAKPVLFAQPGVLPFLWERGGVLPCFLTAARAVKLPMSGLSTSAWLCFTLALLYTEKPGSASVLGSPQGNPLRGCPDSVSGVTLWQGTLFSFVLVAGQQHVERWLCFTCCCALRRGKSPPADPSPCDPPHRERDLCEPVVTRPYSLAELKQITWLSTVGLLMVIFGDCLRKAAMLTAGSNFNHIVQNEKSDTHTLVTSGVYGWFRHPSYVGWFYWSIGTQVPYTTRSDTSVL